MDENLPWALTGGDPVRIRQVLLNLLSNAIKFTDSGHVLISIEVLGRKEGKVRLRLAVEDTGGVGINPEDIPLVYEPMFSLVSASSVSYLVRGGSGSPSAVNWSI